MCEVNPIPWNPWNPWIDTGNSCNCPECPAHNKSRWPSTITWYPEYKPKHRKPGPAQ